MSANIKYSVVVPGRARREFLRMQAALLYAERVAQPGTDPESLVAKWRWSQSLNCWRRDTSF